MYMKEIREKYGLDRATDDIWRDVTAAYYGMISRVDWQFGRVMNKTKEMGLWNKTVTMFFTDHGEFLGDFGLIEKWPSSLTEKLTHDPLIIAGAGLPEDAVFEEMAEMIDLVPTILHLGTVNQTYAQYGKTLLNGLHAIRKGEAYAHKNFSFTEGGYLVNEEPLIEQSPFPYDIKSSLQHNHTELVGKAIAARDKEWTYVYRLYEPDELYSRKGDDPHEAFNLAAHPDYQAVRSRMRETVFEWLFTTADVMPWYKDDREPDVNLVSPWDQYMARLEDEL
jgi:arylsulfatase A-like enzyme